MAWLVGAWLQKTGRPAPRDVRMSRGYTVRVGEMRVSVADAAPGAGSIEVADLALIAELVDVAGLYVNPCRGDVLHAMGPWWMGQPRRIISEGRAELLRGQDRK